MMVRMEIKDVNLWYGSFHALKDINMDIYKNKVTAFIGPSGCGKSTLIRCLNRMNDLIDGVKTTGEILLDGKNIYDKDVDVVKLRKDVGMVFQKPNPFPISIYDNITYGPKLHGVKDKGKLKEIVESNLKGAALWNEVKDILDQNAMSISGGQQQRVCIARCLAIEPEVILFDEPCSALDPISTGKIEDLIIKLKKDYTIVIVTHNMQQAARISDYTGYFYLGNLMEFNKTKKIFTNPDNPQTENYITGKFG
ncbi:MAG: phosphate ABC transporter ATP-binding protein [Candidatus Methanofastidiosa archaeon]|nr:phosphate ABC transporter ATP-binding protein [Candidatus Methanofastidiosa archaeon]